MAAALGCYWEMRHRYADAVDWIDQALNLPGADAHPALRVRALRTKAKCLWQMGRGAEQPAVVAAAEAIARRLGDPVILSKALQLRVDQEINAERLDVADARRRRGAPLGHSRRRRLGDRRGVPRKGNGGVHHRRSARARRHGPPRCSPTSATSTNSRTCSTDAAYAALCLGGDRDATDFAARATPIARALDNPFERMLNSGNLGLAALLTGDTDTASHAFREELTLCRDMVVRPWRPKASSAWPPSPWSHGDDHARRDACRRR